MSTKLRNFLAAVTLLAVPGTVTAVEDGPNFQRDVRPILSDHCFRCHGFDENARQSRLRLDHFDGATRPAESGLAAIIPARPDKSELMRRITSNDPDVRMPPLESGKPLSLAQIETLRRWIGQGARYARHWAFERPVSDAVRRLRSHHAPCDEPSDHRSPIGNSARHTERDGNVHDWPRNVIDVFIQSRLEQAGLRPQEAADPARLLRRVALDLTGLPPTPEDLDHFLQALAGDPDSAYAAEVERLLSSPHFGERLAIDWLDAARYADTNGYFGDKPRQAWPWRDWVIRAFNDNMPFDQFTIEQLAGDLLPNATREQRVATGFHRNSMANNETGIIDEEYRVEAIADRVETTATVWLGMTIGCAQCHDHKYDPISQHEYYQLFAYFNQSVETGLVTKDDPPPTLEVPSPAQEAVLRRSREQREAAEQDFASHSTSLNADLAAWELVAPKELAAVPEDAVVACDFEMGSGRVLGTSLQRERGIRGDAAKFDASQHVELESAFNADRAWTISVWLKPLGSLGCVWSKIEPTDPRRGVEMIWQKGRLQIHLVHRWSVDEIAAATREAMSSNDWHHVLVSYDGTRRAAGLRVIIDGRDAPLSVQRETLTGSLQCSEPLRIGRRDSGLGYYGLLDEFRILPRAVSAAESTAWPDSEQLEGILARTDRSAAEQTVLRDYYIAHRSPSGLRDSHQRLQQARREENASRAAIPTALVMQDLAQPRKTHLLVRGQYDKPAAEVQPGVPKVFPRRSTAVAELARVQTSRHDLKSGDFSYDASGDVPNRLAFARWLVSPEHPLTARVAVNRLWQMCFGDGLVRTPNDFGSQGELPTHPELLDELAVRFVDSGWDVKALLRLIVTSATYRQSSQASAELLQRDPDNRLLARGPRFRLPAELLRDQALAVSGLFSPRIGGPSVKPYQPEGLWEDVSYNAEDTYVPDRDDGLWRRSLYTYWKRQVPPPALLTWDANTREKCVVRRSRTNTPLQALVVLNDVTYVEAARNLAALTLKERDRDVVETLRDTASGSRSAPATKNAPKQQTDDELRLRAIFRRAVSRWPEPFELQVLADLLARQRRAFVAEPAAAEHLIQVGASPRASSLDPGELAAWTLVAQTILNLDEVITRR